MRDASSQSSMSRSGCACSFIFGKPRRAMVLDDAPGLCQQLLGTCLL